MMKILFFTIMFTTSIFASKEKTINICDKGQIIRAFAKDFYNSSCSSLSIKNFQSLKDYLKEKKHLVISEEIAELEENAFDPELFSHVKHIYFQYSGIKKIKKNAFLGLSLLTSITISFEGLEEIEVGAFEGLSSLNELILGFNNITEIKENTFSGLSSLKHLALHENQISEISKSAFKGLSSLESLVLSRNNIQKINKKTFEGLQSLSRLGILDNPLSEIYENTFSHLGSLGSIEIDQDKILILKKDLNYYGLTEKVKFKNHFF